MKKELKVLLYSILALAALISSFALFICSLFDIYDFRCNNEIKDGINAIFRLILSISVNRTATDFKEKLDELEGTNIGKGNPEWGAPEEDVFIIKLGNRL